MGLTSTKLPNKRCNLGDDDAGLLAFEFLCAGKLATKELDKAARTGAAIGAQKAHAEEKDQQLQNFGIFQGLEGSLCGVLAGFCDEGGKRAVECVLKWNGRGLLIDDARGKSFVGFGEGANCGEDVGIGSRGLAGAELGNGKRDGGEKLAVGVNGVGGDADILKGGIRRNGAPMLVFVTMGGNQVAAVRGTIDGDFPLRATTDSANFFRFRGTKAPGFALLTNWTNHSFPHKKRNSSAEYAAARQKTKPRDEGLKCRDQES